MNVFCKLSVLCLALCVGEPKEPKVIYTGCQYDKSVKAYTQVDQLPEYPGGLTGYSKFFIHNFKYPDTSIIQPRINIEFVVKPNGSLSKIGIYKKRKEGYTIVDKEGIRVFKLMPRWKPGTCGGKAVPVHMVMPNIVELQSWLSVGM